MTTTILDPQVNVIPATKRHVQNGDQLHRQTGLRVAAYCRVSTEEETQETSYIAQKTHYTRLIENRPGWKLAGIYADEGKTGTTRKGRARFNEMMDDCRVGKVDYIITKSISRFARNTVDALDCVHELQRLRPPVGVWFERENIDTLNANSELFLTFYCSMAQEESHSISENIKWSLQKNFRSGKPQINLRRMLGYDMGRDGTWSVNEEEAAIVRYIYSRFLGGMSANGIARELNEAGYRTVNGKYWRADAVFYILRNEKYAGDILMQKTYTESYLTHKAIRNTGEVPQYFKENHHPALVSREIWNKTQELLLYKQRGGARQVRTVMTGEGEVEIGVGQCNKTTQEAYALQASCEPGKNGPSNPFSLLSCACCGRRMRRMSYHAYLKEYGEEPGPGEAPEKEDYVYSFSYGVWKCPGTGGTNKTDKKGCRAKTLPEMSIEQSFMEMLYRLRRDLACHGEEAELIRAFNRIYASLSCREKGSGLVEEKLKLLNLEISQLEAHYQETLERLNTVSYGAGIRIGNTMLASGGQTYARLAEDLKKRIKEKKEEQSRLSGARGAVQLMKQNFDAFLTAVKALPEMASAGTPELFPFDEYVFRTFVLRMDAAGDEIRYGMSFGLTLTGTGNSRPIRAYLGYRRIKKDGAVEVIERAEQLAPGKIQRRRRVKKAAKADPLP